MGGWVPHGLRSTIYPLAKDETASMTRSFPDGKPIGRVDMPSQRSRTAADGPRRKSRRPTGCCRTPPAACGVPLSLNAAHVAQPFGEVGILHPNDLRRLRLFTASSLPLSHCCASRLRSWPRISSPAGSLGAAYDWGGESRVEGVAKGDYRETLFFGLSAGISIDQRSSVQVTYVGNRAKKDIGADSDNVGLAYTIRF